MFSYEERSANATAPPKRGLRPSAPAVSVTCRLAPPLRALRRFPPRCPRKQLSTRAAFATLYEKSRRRWASLTMSIVAGLCVSRSTSPATTLAAPL